ncbi:hypothetical protein I549_5405 [Mycobacterium avium subsp. avium 2285 (R)]|nr:hypothetical protein I549_5405 [Mycobacterium avium subsp. avium 2285 (R)]
MQRPHPRRAVRSAGRRLFARNRFRVDVEAITELFLTALAEPYDDSEDKTRQQLRRIGAVALATDTVPARCAAG